MNTGEEKKAVRAEIRRRRLQLEEEFLNEVDKELPEDIFSLEDDEFRARLKSAKRIALYRATGGEVPCDGLAKALMKNGKICCFPRIEGDDMVFCDCSELDEKFFASGAFGIREPVASLAAVDPEIIDIVVLPAVAYNEEGTRLGQGKGYYDRFYAGIKGKKPLLLGVCYDFQISSEIPVEEHDITADVIIAVPTAEDNDEEEE
ncbi:MAG: 5-formyltetrahydrofolate cyclo-ligase [Clostridiales bacterium]|nr:5-formyltetrahydrofolate cyclo-ligase [Clostridiales bacterium]